MSGTYEVHVIRWYCIWTSLNLEKTCLNHFEPQKNKAHLWTITTLQLNSRDYYISRLFVCFSLKRFLYTKYIFLILQWNMTLWESLMSVKVLNKQLFMCGMSTQCHIVAQCVIIDRENIVRFVYVRVSLIRLFWWACWADRVWRFYTTIRRSPPPLPLNA